VVFHEKRGSSVPVFRDLEEAKNVHQGVLLLNDEDKQIYFKILSDEIKATYFNSLHLK